MNTHSTVDFPLYDWLRAESLSKLPRLVDHSRRKFDAELALVSGLLMKNTHRLFVWLIRKSRTLAVKKIEREASPNV